MTDTTIRYEELSREDLIILAKAKTDNRHPHSFAAMLDASPKEARRIARRQVAWYSWAFMAVGFGSLVAGGIFLLTVFLNGPTPLP